MKKTTLRVGFLLAAFHCFSAAFFGQEIRLLKDLRTDGDQAPRLSLLEKMGERAFFLRYSLAEIALFSTDGAAIERVRTLRDFCGQPADPGILNGPGLASLAADGGSRLFVFQSNGFGQPTSIWLSDGSENGTKKLVDWPSHAAVFGPASGGKAIFLGQRLLFESQQKLFSTDGTTAAPLALLPPNALLQNQSLQTSHGGRAYFLGYDPAEGLEIWATDGANPAFQMTAAAGPDGLLSIDGEGEAGGKKLFLAREQDGTMVLFAVAPGSSQLEKLKSFGQAFFPTGSILRMPVRDGKVLFRVRTAAGRQQIWASDGTVGGTNFFLDPDPEGQISGFSTDPIGLFKGRVFCFGKLPNQVAGTLIFDGVNPPETLTGRTINHFFEQNGLFFGFVGLYQSEPLGIMRLFDDAPVPALAWSAGTFLSVQPREFFFWKGQISRFASESGPTGVRTFWQVFDGSDMASVAQIDLAPSSPWPISSVILGGEKLVVSPGLRRIVACDGTQNGTLALLENATESYSSNHLLWPSAGEKAFFYGDVAQPGGGFSSNQIWATDGTEAGTKAIVLPPGITSNYGTGLEADGRFWFSAQADFEQPALWRTVGSSAEKVADVPGPSFLPLDPQAFDGERVWFWAHQNELWRSDGTAAGTLRVTEGAQPFEKIRCLGKKAIFQKATNANGFEFWVSDGTEAGTKMLVDALGGLESGAVGSAHVGQNLAFFAARNAASSLAVWRTDGSAGGTTLDVFWPAPDFVSNIQFLGNAGAKTIFSASVYEQSTAQSRTELWATDGATAEKLVDDLPIFGPFWLDEIGGKLAFFALEILPNVGAVRQLWTTDGTTAGTKKVDPKPCAATGSGFWDIASPTSAGGEWWFVAVPCPGDPLEIWRSDGTEAGTQKAAIDSCDGPAEPFGLVRFGAGRLLFSAVDQQHGREPWVIETPIVAAPEPPSPYNKDAQRLTAAPNPFADQLFWVKSEASDGQFFEKVWLTDALGRVVFEKADVRANEPLRPSPALPDGAYFLFVKKPGKTAEAIGTVLKKG